MRIPDSLVSLVDDGIIDEVVRPLMSGKEAQVFLVLAGGEERVAKVYKEANARTFKHRVAYTEGRRVKNSRDQRAIDSRSRHGRAKEEAAWRSAEVDMIYRLHYAGVRVPIPYNFSDGVLVMELIKDFRGFPAPRLGDVALHPDEALAIYETLMQEVVKMLCAGVVHGDLSDFNVLLSERGPVVIDFPQSMNAASNQNARPILVRDVANLYRFLSRFIPGRPPMRHAEEMWDLFQRGELRPETVLTGRFRASSHVADTSSLLRELDAVTRDESRRRVGLGLRALDTTPHRPDDRVAQRPAQREQRPAQREQVRTPQQHAPHREQRAPQREPYAPSREQRAPQREPYAPHREQRPVQRGEPPVERRPIVVEKGPFRSAPAANQWRAEPEHRAAPTQHPEPPVPLAERPRHAEPSATSVEGAPPKRRRRRRRKQAPSA